MMKMTMTSEAHIHATKIAIIWFDESWNWLKKEEEEETLSFISFCCWSCFIGYLLINNKKNGYWILDMIRDYKIIHISSLL